MPIWLQELQDEKLPNFTGQPVNKELKNLGHGVRDITTVVSGLMATSPQQVIQTRKSGTSRQARKSYKGLSGADSACSVRGFGPRICPGEPVTFVTYGCP